MTFSEILVLGVVGGVSPGPITALMLGETFKRGFKTGARVPLALIFSNVLVGGASIALFFLGRDLTPILSLFTYIGAAILIWMGLHELKASGKLRLNTSSKPFQKGLLIELGNPHPYIFWFGVLAPNIVLEFARGGVSSILLSWAAFTCGLVGTKLIVVLLADQIRSYLTEKHILWVNRVLALVLIGFGISLLLSNAT